jgi:hypothetical protein
MNKFSSMTFNLFSMIPSLKNNFSFSDNTNDKIPNNIEEIKAIIEFNLLFFMYILNLFIKHHLFSLEFFIF